MTTESVARKSGKWTRLDKTSADAWAIAVMKKVARSKGVITMRTAKKVLESDHGVVLPEGVTVDSMIRSLIDRRLMELRRGKLAFVGGAGRRIRLDLRRDELEAAIEGLEVAYGINAGSKESLKFSALRNKFLRSLGPEA